MEDKVKMLKKQLLEPLEEGNDIGEDFFVYGKHLHLLFLKKEYKINIKYIKHKDEIISFSFSVIRDNGKDTIEYLTLRYSIFKPVPDVVPTITIYLQRRTIGKEDGKETSYNVSGTTIKNKIEKELLEVITKYSYFIIDLYKFFLVMHDAEKEYCSLDFDKMNNIFIEKYKL